MKRILTAAILSFSLIFSAALASAGTMINSWNYNADGIFVDYHDSLGGTTIIQGSDAATLSWIFDAGGFNPGSDSGYRTLTWGDQWRKSSIDIDPVSGGTLVTNDLTPPDANGIYLTHVNNPITDSPYNLNGGKVRATLELTAADPYIMNFPVLSTLLEFSFFETPNSGLYPNDIFVLLNPEVTVETFIFDGYFYTFKFTGFQQITDSLYLDFLEDNGFDVSGPVFGWLTAENATTGVPTYLTIEAVATPEPGTLMILGAGLLGLAAVRRRFRK